MTNDTRNRQPQGIPVGGQFAATAHSDDVPSLTAPKTSSRGRTTTVTLPDGTTQTRTSKTREYSHAIVLSPHVPEKVIANREALIRSAEAAITARDEALREPQFRKKTRFPREQNPDTDYQGRPSYHGFEYYLMSADGKERLEDVRGNSTGDTGGSYDPVTHDYDVNKPGRAVPQLKIAAAVTIARARKDIESYKADIESVKAGTFDLGGYSVPAWSSRADLAQKAANQYSSWTRNVSVLPVDQ